jgi:hypothetical protein
MKFSAAILDPPLFDSDDSSLDKSYIPDPDSIITSSEEEVVEEPAKEKGEATKKKGRRGQGKGKTSTMKVLKEAAENIKVTGALKPCPFCGQRRRSHLKKHIMAMHPNEVGNKGENASKIQAKLRELFTKHGISRYPESYIRRHFGVLAEQHWARLMTGLDMCSIQVIPQGTSWEQICDPAMPLYQEAEAGTPPHEGEGDGVQQVGFLL